MEVFSLFNFIKVNKIFYNGYILGDMYILRNIPIDIVEFNENSL